MIASSEVQDDSGEVQKDAYRPPPVMLIDRVSGEVRSSREWDVIMGGHLERPLVFSKVTFPPPMEKKVDLSPEQDVKPFHAATDYQRIPRNGSPSVDEMGHERQLVSGGWQLEKAAQVLRKEPPAFGVVPVTPRASSPLRKTSVRMSDLQDRPYECHVCTSRFLKKHHLQAHLLTHSNIRPFVCSTCGKSYRLRQHLTRHEQQHFGLRPHICELCGMTFRLREHLKRHQVVRHQMWRAETENGGVSQLKGASVVDTTEQATEFGAKTLPALSSIEVQRPTMAPHPVRERSPPQALSKDSQRSIYCKMCTMQFQSSEELIAHEQWHESKGEVLLCPHCPREFHRIDNLYRHLVTHKDRAEFVCGDCGRTFGRRDNLARHQRSACRILHTDRQLFNNVC